jgi:proline iminopeptidase
MGFCHDEEVRALAVLLACPIAASAAVAAAVAAVADENVDRPLERDLDIAAHRVSLHVHVVGPERPAEAVVVIPGGPGLSWDYLAPLAQLATARRAMVFLDPRGVGKSTRPSVDDYGLATQVEDIDAVRAALGLGQIHLIGHSWGTVPAMAYAFDHPERVASLVLVGVGAPTAKDDRRLFQSAFAARKAQLLQRGLIHKPSGDDCMAGFTASLPAHFADPRHPGARRLPGSYRCDVGHAVLEAAGEWDFRADLARLERPMLLVVGDADANLAGARLTAAAASHADLVHITFRSCGHFPWLECPEPFFGAVGRFLSQQKP